MIARNDHRDSLIVGQRRRPCLCVEQLLQQRTFTAGLPVPVGWIARLKLCAAFDKRLQGRRLGHGHDERSACNRTGGLQADVAHRLGQMEDVHLLGVGDDARGLQSRETAHSRDEPARTFAEASCTGLGAAEFLRADQQSQHAMLVRTDGHDVFELIKMAAARPAFAEVFAFRAIQHQWTAAPHAQQQPLILDEDVAVDVIDLFRIVAAPEHFAGGRVTGRNPRAMVAHLPGGEVSHSVRDRHIGAHRLVTHQPAVGDHAPVGVSRSDLLPEQFSVVGRKAVGIAVVAGEVESAVDTGGRQP